MNRTEEQWVQYASDLMVELAIAKAKLEEMTIDRDYWRDAYRPYQ